MKTVGFDLEVSLPCVFFLNACFCLVFGLHIKTVLRGNRQVGANCLYPSWCMPRLTKDLLNKCVLMVARLMR